eukprot:scaffold2396_cov184-Skeletonema_dohrnii-CCMP3373.AAC.4
MPGQKFFVIEFSCAPSQKGIGTEGKVYSMRLVFRETENGWVLMETPYSLCACAVGVLNICAHKGSALCLVWAIRNCFTELDFDTLQLVVPPSIHAVASQIHLMHYLYPAPYDDEYKMEQKIKKDAKETVEAEAANDAANEDLELEDENEMQSNNAILPTINLRQEIKKWVEELKLSIDNRGMAHKCDIQESIAASVTAAEPNKDVLYELRKRIRLINQVKSLSEGTAPKTLYGCYCKENAPQDLSYTGRLRDYYKDPYKEIYEGHDSDNDSLESNRVGYEVGGEFLCIGTMHSEDENDDSSYDDEMASKDDDTSETSDN